MRHRKGGGHRRPGPSESAEGGAFTHRLKPQPREGARLPRASECTLQPSDQCVYGTAECVRKSLGLVLYVGSFPSLGLPGPDSM